MEAERSTRVFPPAHADTAGGATGTISLRPSGPCHAVDLTGSVHLLPCAIKHTGPCAISDYFKPRKTDLEAEGLSVEEAFFRGRKLQGVTTPLSDGYRGYVLQKRKSGEGEDTEASGGHFSDWVSRVEFQRMSYWNHDSLPSSDDPLPRCFHWLHVSKALHKQVTTDEMEKSICFPQPEE